MASHSNIGWTDFTFNPWIGCTKVSPACDRCYAEDLAKRYAKDVTWGKPGQRAKLRRTATWKDPLAWNRKALKEQTFFAGARPKVFCASLADVFDNDAPPEWRAELWMLIKATPALDWLLLTKRPQNMADMVPWADGSEPPWPNVWLGTTAEDQERYDQRRLHLLNIPARVHFFSVEPMLGMVVRDRANERGKNVWYICGGESGPNYRPLNMAAVDHLWQSCVDDKVPFFFKQDSSIKPGCKGRARDALWACKQFPVTA